MDSMLLYLLFPSLFMIHEMEEILLMPSFMSSMVENPKFKKENNERRYHTDSAMPIPPPKLNFG